jgi:hypothetical protein
VSCKWLAGIFRPAKASSAAGSISRPTLPFPVAAGIGERATLSGTDMRVISEYPLDPERMRPGE